MAFSKATIATTTFQMTIRDRAGTPVNDDLDGIEVDSLIPPAMLNRLVEEVMCNSGSGQAHWSVQNLGIEGGQTWDISLIASDPSTSNVDNWYDLFTGLVKDDLSGTSFSTRDYTNQLTGKGKLMPIVVVTGKNAVGTTYSWTFDVSADKASYDPAGKHLGLKVTLRVLSEIVAAEV